MDVNLSVLGLEFVSFPQAALPLHAGCHLTVLVGGGNVTTPQLNHKPLGNRDAHSCMSQICLDLELVLNIIDAMLG